MRIISWLASVLLFAFPLAAQQINPSNQISWGAIYYNQPGDSIASIEATCANACTYVISSPMTSTLTSNHTLSSNVSLYFQAGGVWTVNGGFTLTIPNQVQGTLTKHFAGSAAIKLNQSLVPVEWFGAVGDGVTDNTTALNAALNALTQGQILLQAKTYAHSGPMTITRSSIGIKGSGVRVTDNFQYVNPPATILLNTSAGADTIDVSGTSTSSNVGFNRFEEFSIERSVVPTGTATGISLNFTYGVYVGRVNIQDNIRGFYVHAGGAQGVGVIENCTVEWGYNGITETTGSLYGIFLDSADGTQSPSFRVRHSLVSSNLPPSGPTTYGAAFIGAAINDQMFYGFESAQVAYGVYLQQTGTPSVIGSSDLHFYGGIHDGCHISCYFITGLTAAAGAGVEINGAYLTTLTVNMPLIDIESSSGVRVNGVQFGIANGGVNTCVNVTGSSNVSLIGNLCNGVISTGFLVKNSTAVTVSGNVLSGQNDANGLILLQNSSLNSVIGNVLTGTGLSLVLDASSNGNAGISLNAIAASLAVASNLGNNPIPNGTSQWLAASGAPSGTCNNGSMYSNSATTTGTFATYQCKSSAWVGLGTAY